MRESSEVTFHARFPIQVGFFPRPKNFATLCETYKILEPVIFFLILQDLE